MRQISFLEECYESIQKNCTCDLQGMEILTFKDNGKVEHGNKDFKYTVEQNGESYMANFKVAGVKGEITIETKDATETVFKLGSQKMNVTKK